MEIQENKYSVRSNVTTTENNKNNESNKGQVNKPKKSVRELTKTLRLKGEKYIGYSRSKTGEIKHDTVREERSMKNRCLHKASKNITQRTLLCNKVSETDRRRAFEYFWSLSSWTARKTYLRGLVTTKTPTRRRKHVTNTESRKKTSHDCFLSTSKGKVLVCKTMLLNTLNVGRNTFERWTLEKQINPKENSDTSKKIRSNDNPNKLQLMKWLQNLPKVPGCTSSKRLCIESMFRSNLHMYEVYKNFCNANKLRFISLTLFRNILKAENISINKPRNEQYDLWKSEPVFDEINDKQIKIEDAVEEVKEEIMDFVSEEKFLISIDPLILKVEADP